MYWRRSRWLNTSQIQTLQERLLFLFWFLNCTAIALMWSKFQEIKRALRNNARDEKRINNLTAIFDYDDSLFPGEGSPYLRICSRAMDATSSGETAGQGEDELC